MDIIFFRHGDADPASARVGDEERRLTDRGREETLAVARALGRAGARPECILTSPLVRARQTGEVLAEALGVAAEAEDALRPGCALGGLQSLLAGRRERSILLVGHEPDLGRMVGQLAGGARVEMRKSGAALVYAERLEPGQGVLRWLLSPSLLGSE